MWYGPVVRAMTSLGLVALSLGAARGAPPDPIEARLLRAAEAMRGQLSATRRDLHMHPELSNRETRTQRVVLERLRALGLDEVRPLAKTGVLGVLRGGRPGGVVALRADLDA